jgi:putative endopeptidase
VRLVESEMGQAVGRLYTARHFAPETRAPIEEMVAQIRLAMRGRIERIAWMSPQTRDKALDKLSRMQAKIAHPKMWRDYSGLDVRPGDLVGNLRDARIFEWRRKVARLNSPVDRDEWDMTPQTVDAYYSSNLNVMVLPAALLQAPYFDPAADPAVNYGGIGALIGHELIHGFDDDGRKYDARGALSNWWTDADAHEFDARAAALSRQYGTFEPFPGAHVNGDLTLSENIADLGGVLVAFDAYRHSLAGRPAPVLDGLTGEQRFFLGYAQTFRAKRTDEEARRQLVADPHAPERYRVNGVVRNVDAWYEAFDVRPGDKLYLAMEDRVRLW